MVIQFELCVHEELAIQHFLAGAPTTGKAGSPAPSTHHHQQESKKIARLSHPERCKIL